MKTLSILCAGLIWVLTQGCSDDLDTFYGNEDAVYFQEFIYNSAGKKVGFNSLTYSFGSKEDAIQSDTLKIVVCFNGRQATQARQYRVVVADTGAVRKGKTTMEAGKDFDPIPEVHVLPANQWADTLKIVLYRRYMDPSFRKQLNKYLILRLEPTADFRLGTVENTELKVVANNYLAEPQWWKAKETYFRYYHPEKLRALIGFDSRFDVQDDGLTVSDWDISLKYAGILRNYLNDMRLIDPETNEYILMDEMVPVE